MGYEVDLGKVMIAGTVTKRVKTLGRSQSQVMPSTEYKNAHEGQTAVILRIGDNGQQSCAIGLGGYFLP